MHGVGYKGMWNISGMEKKPESGNELPNPSGEKMVSKKNLNTEVHIKMRCMRTSQRKINSILFRKMKTNRQINLYLYNCTIIKMVEKNMELVIIS